ncbi:MAG: sporulation protein YqfD [Syntrophomonadaceae bacterium]|nr:sporulation protein YqfD [Syntrophomonadaceae bacterium]
MGNKLFEQIGGTIKITLRGKNQERAINMASTRGVFLWDIKKRGDDLELKVRTSGFSALKQIAEENNFELEVQDRRGLPFIRTILRRRMAFIGGGFLFVVAMYLLSSFVWSVDVGGNKTIARERIIVAAARHGVYPGAPKWTFSCSEVEKALLQEIDDISYVRLDLKGVKANIKVVEKIVPLQNIDGPGNIVAKKDGMVESVLVLDGQAQVKRGDVVAKGDILISGLVIPQPSPYVSPEEQIEMEPSLVKARGEVKARVWCQGYGECRLKTETLRRGKGKQNKYYLIIPGRTLSLNLRDEVRFQFYNQKVFSHLLRTRWGEIGFKRVVLRENIKEVKVYSEEEALAIAKTNAWKDLKKEAGPGFHMVASRVKMISSPSEPLIRVRVIAESIENIALVQPINADAK